ncbi:MAG: hypothetical protein JSW47_12730 [Phycisphaerales bacterium]|nr:MAG: hypothetical protein JSW47_12730 [Phycisphaerales bacterium]
MAKLTFNIEELVEVVISNGLLPPEIVRLRVKGERIHFVIRTGSFVLPFIPASLKYLRFDGDSAVFELAVVSSRSTKAMGRLSDMIELSIPGYVKLEYPNVFVEINRLLEDKNVKGIRVKDILFEDGRFSIATGKN